MTTGSAAPTVLVALVTLAAVPLAAQPAPEPGSAATGTPGRFTAPRTPWGDPDLQGIWPAGPLMAVPFERPEELGDRGVISEDAVEARAAELGATIEQSTNTPPHWLELEPGPRLSSLVVDPEDGRVPPLTPDGARRARHWRTTSAPTYPYAGPEDLRPYDRCITRGVLGSAYPNIYSAGMQILQTPGLVVIRYEMVHETRVIPLDGRPHLSEAIRPYMGDPRGHWEGETLVVETTNFNGATGSYGRNGDGNPTSEALRLVERFRLSDADTLQYEVHIEDPQTFTRPWTVAFPLTRDPSYTIYEYACHEGNHAMLNMLSAARAGERGEP